MSGVTCFCANSDIKLYRIYYMMSGVSNIDPNTPDTWQEEKKIVGLAAKPLQIVWLTLLQFFDDPQFTFKNVFKNQ